MKIKIRKIKNKAEKVRKERWENKINAENIICRLLSPADLFFVISPRPFPAPIIFISLLEGFVFFYFYFTLFSSVFYVSSISIPVFRLLSLIYFLFLSASLGSLRRIYFPIISISHRAAVLFSFTGAWNCSLIFNFRSFVFLF